MTLEASRFRVLSREHFIAPVMQCFPIIFFLPKLGLFFVFWHMASRRKVSSSTTTSMARCTTVIHRRVRRTSSYKLIEPWMCSVWLRCVLIALFIYTNMASDASIYLWHSHINKVVFKVVNNHLFNFIIRINKVYYRNITNYISDFICKCHCLRVKF